MALVEGRSSSHTVRATEGWESASSGNHQQRCNARRLMRQCACDLRGGQPLVLREAFIFPNLLCYSIPPEPRPRPLPEPPLSPPAASVRGGESHPPNGHPRPDGVVALTAACVASSSCASSTPTRATSVTMSAACFVGVREGVG
jgi:hypothetical protein